MVQESFISNIHLLLQVFTNNGKLCVKVTESELSPIFHIASNCFNQAELFTTLLALTKVCLHTPADQTWTHTKHILCEELELSLLADVALLDSVQRGC